MINLDGVWKEFDTKREEGYLTALTEVSLHIPKGEIIGIIGKSGAGKTTLLKLICGLIAPSKGRIRVMGFDPIKKRRRLSARLGVLFTNTTALNLQETVKTNLKMIKNTYKLNRSVFDLEFISLSERFGISDIMNEAVKTLSLGQRRRVELVSLFLLQADLYIMEEPCFGLDPDARMKCEEQIKLLRERGKTIIIASHNMREIERICTRIIILNHGKRIFYGDMRELYRQFTPIDVMTVKCSDKLPNVQDLPVISYSIDGLTLTLSYNTNHISAAEIVRVLLQSASISEINIKKPSLEDVISAIERK
jgi:ABC-2 type transport system ATP-binding protein